MNQIPSSPRKEQLAPVVYLSPADELANIVTHSLGFILSLCVLGFLFGFADSQSVGLRVACIVFSCSMATVYFFSTLSHAVQEPVLRNRLRAWDQGTIYFLIAGTYTPFLWQDSPPGFRLAMLVAVWLAALFGFYAKVLAAHRINAVSTATYLALGWLPAIPLVGRTPWICFVWMLAGGLCFTIGVLFLKQSSRIRYAHAVWHLLVMLGSACHCTAIYQLLA